jgi:hypothetical protein
VCALFGSLLERIRQVVTASYFDRLNLKSQ